MNTKNNKAVLSHLFLPLPPRFPGAPPRGQELSHILEATALVHARAGEGPSQEPHAVCGEAPEERQSHLSTFVKRNKSISQAPHTLTGSWQEGPRGSFHTGGEVGVGEGGTAGSGSRAPGLWLRNEPGLEVCGLSTTKPLPDSRFKAQEEAPLHKHKHSANE